MPIDYSRYPPNWKKEIVPRILDRAGHCCEFCQIPNGANAHSVPLRVQDVDGRYKLKRFWITSEGDLIRMKAFAYPDIKAVRVVLTIAHLDHDETNHDVPDDRLAALCQYCHLNYDSSEKYRRAISKVKPADLFPTNQEPTDG